MRKKSTKKSFWTLQTGSQKCNNSPKKGVKMLEKLYKEVKKRLEKLNFGDIFTGFHEFKFAIYDETGRILTAKQYLAIKIFTETPR